MVVQVHAARQLLVALVAFIAWFLLEMWHQLRRCSMQMGTNVDDVGARREPPLDEASRMTAPPSSEDRDRLARHGDTGTFRVARCLGARSDCLSKEARRTRPDNAFIFVPAFVPGSASRLWRTLIRRTAGPNRPPSGRSDRTVRRASGARHCPLVLVRKSRPVLGSLRYLAENDQGRALLRTPVRLVANLIRRIRHVPPQPHRGGRSSR